MLNFGVSGHGTAQQLQVLRHYVWPYEPDLVLLAFFPGNDVRNNSRQLESDHVKPFFVVRHGELVLDERFLQHPDYIRAGTAQVRFKVKSINSSRLLQLANQWKNRIASRAEQVASPGPQTDVQALKEDADPPWQKAWEVTERLVAEMHRESKARGVRFCVALVTQDFQVDPGCTLRGRVFSGKMAFRTLIQRNCGWRNSASGRGFLVIGLAEPLRRYADAHAAHLHGLPNTQLGRGHWNETGHRLAGEQIAAAIEAGIERWKNVDPGEAGRGK